MPYSSEYQNQTQNSAAQTQETSGETGRVEYRTADFVLGLSAKALEAELAAGRAQRTRFTAPTASGYRAREVAGPLVNYQSGAEGTMQMRLRWLQQGGVNRQSQPYASNNLTLEAVGTDGQPVQLGQIINSRGSLTNDNVLVRQHEDGNLLSIPPDSPEAAGLYETMLDVGHRMQVVYDRSASQNLARSGVQDLALAA